MYHSTRHDMYHPPWSPLRLALYLIAGAEVLLAADNVVTSTPVQVQYNDNITNDNTLNF